jgi:alkaline phosphatase D
MTRYPEFPVRSGMRADQPKDVVENSAPSGDELRTGRHLTRRRFLQVGGATAVLLVPGAQALATPANPGRLPEGLFGLGVASGDPLPDAVVIWTRLAPEPLALDGNGGMPSRKVPVHWEVARDEGFRQVVRRGMFLTAPDLGHSVHVDVTGLASGSCYYYRLRVQPDISPTARPRTEPV